jgi:FAD/FMN-containing dehydrogenase
VLPGTRHVTVGGAVAADVHGKNHHVDGAFCRHVDSLRVLTADGRALRCSRTEEPELFRACCGGMGLAGIVLEATLRLAPRRGDRFRRRTLACPDLDHALLELGQATASHTVAWVDAASHGRALGRALVYLGEPHEETAPPPRTSYGLALPVPPLGLNLVRPAVARAFNAAVWAAGQRRHGREDLQHYAAFFWPLDALDGWNRLYGRRGFLQFQCLLPAGLLAWRGAAPFHELLELFQAAGGGALAVMKTMGPRDEATAPIAFPGPGATLALDLPASPAGRAAVRRANGLVADWGGRVYLAKDALLEPAQFAAMTPGLGEWRALRERWDPGRRWQTHLSKRLEL